MINKFLLLGAVLLFSSAIDVVVAYFVLPPETRIYLYGAAGLTTIIGIIFLMKGLATPQS